MSVPSNDLTVPVVGAAGTPTADPTDRGLGSQPWSLALSVVLIGLGAAIMLGAAWVALAPVTVGWAGAGEDEAARDVTFGLLEVLAGVITAVALLIWPGRRPAAHVAGVLGMAICVSLLAWGIGLLLGAHPLKAVALVVVWPLVAAAVTVIRSLIAVLFGSS